MQYKFEVLFALCLISACVWISNATMPVDIVVDVNENGNLNTLEIWGDFTNEWYHYENDMNTATVNNFGVYRITRTSEGLFISKELVMTGQKADITMYHHDQTGYNNYYQCSQIHMEPCGLFPAKTYPITANTTISWSWQH